MKEKSRLCLRRLISETIDRFESNADRSLFDRGPLKTGDIGLKPDGVMSFWGAADSLKCDEHKDHQEASSLSVNLFSLARCHRLSNKLAAISSSDVSRTRTPSRRFLAPSNE